MSGIRFCAMRLRDHPLVCYQGIRCWPPTWTIMSGAKKADIPVLHGEVGILTSVSISSIDPRPRCYLTISYEGQSYMGVLLFSEDVDCRQIRSFLQQHTGKSIREIGDLDVSHTL